MVSALFKAAEAGDLDSVKEALNEQHVDLEIKDHTGTTPLIIAIKGSHVDVVKELLLAGADPLNPSSSGPPFMHTSLPDILSLLPPPPLVQPSPANQPPMHYPSPPFYPSSEMYAPPNSGEILYPANANNGYYAGGGGYMPYGPGFMPAIGPPHMMGPPQMMAYGMNGFMPGPGMQMMDPQMQQQQQQAPPPPLQQQQNPVQEGENGKVDGGAGTIPPPDISKNIPCKFFPNCKYGNQCAFSHPAPPPSASLPIQQSTYSPSPSMMYPPYDPSSPMYHPYPHHPHAQPSFYPMNPYGYPHPSPPPPIPMNVPVPPPPMHAISSPPPPFSPRAIPPSMDYDGDNAFVVVPPVNQVPPVFAPASSFPSPAPPIAPAPLQVFAPSFVPQQTPSPSPPPAPSPDAPAPSSTETTPQPTAKPNLPFQPKAGGKFGPFHHAGNGPAGFGKKFFGGRHQGTNKWVGGNAPPCSFFQAGACRNADMCRFPHLLADGTDCRLPGVIDGSIPSAPISIVAGKQGPSRGPFSPNFPATTKALQTTAAQKITQSSSPDTLLVDQLSLESPSSADKSSTDVAPSTSTPNPPHPFARPIIPQAARSQPPTRAGSPIVSHYPNHFLPPRNPRSMSATAFGGRNPLASGSAAASAGGAAPPVSSGSAGQKIPSSADFPALGSSTGSVKDLGGSGVLVAGAKTAAQILSAPAPEKVKGGGAGGIKSQGSSVKPVEVKEREAVGSSEDCSESSSTDKSDESGEDAVVIIKSNKAAPSAPNGAPSPAAGKKNLVSFAHMVGGVKG